MMKEVDTFFKKCKEDVKDFYSINTQLQGPQGCVSFVFSDNVQTFLHTLQSLLKDFPHLKDEISTEAISTERGQMNLCIPFLGDVHLLLMLTNLVKSYQS